MKPLRRKLAPRKRERDLWEVFELDANEVGLIRANDADDKRRIDCYFRDYGKPGSHWPKYEIKVECGDYGLEFVKHLLGTDDPVRVTQLLRDLFFANLRLHKKSNPDGTWKMDPIPKNQAVAIQKSEDLCNMRYRAQELMDYIPALSQLPRIAPNFDAIRAIFFDMTWVTICDDSQSTVTE